MKFIKKYRFHFIRILIAVVIIAVFLRWTNIFGSINQIKSINQSFFLLAIFTVFCIHMSKMFRFYYLARDLQIGIGLKDTIIAHFIAPIVGRITPAKLGEGIKILLLKHDKKKLSFVFIMEKLADTLTLLIIAVFAIYTFGSYYNAYVTLAILFLLVVIALFNVEKILNTILRKDILEDQWFKNLIFEITPTQWIAYSAFSTIIRFLIMSVPYIISIALELKISLWLIFQTYAIAILIGNISGLPGGIGTREVTFSFLLVNYALLGKESAGIIAILIIVTDLILESLLGLIGWGWYKARAKRK